MRFLLTGGRSLACVEWAQKLYERGHIVYVCDSMPVYVSQIYQLTCIEKCLHTTCPNTADDINEYKQDLMRILDEYKIDIVLPVNEETLHVVKCLGDGWIEMPGDKRRVYVFSSNIKTLDRMHNKYTFNQFLQHCNLPCAKSVICQSVQQASDLVDRNDGQFVLKPMYSRGSTKTIINAKPSPSTSDISPSNPWIMQDFVEGDEYCCYLICIDGKIHANATYKHDFVVNTASGIHFEAVNNVPEIEEFCLDIIGKLKFTGQISFDLILEKQAVAGGELESNDCKKKRKVYAIECNPRATSGIHLLPSEIVDIFDNLIFSFAGQTSSSPSRIIRPKQGDQCKCGLALFLMGPLQINSMEKFYLWINALTSGRDSSLSIWNPMFAVFQMFALTIIWVQSVWYGMEMMDIGTRDISWDYCHHRVLLSTTPNIKKSHK